MKKSIVILIFMFVGNYYCQIIRINKIEPPNWWVGMKKSNIQLMLYGENLSDYKVHFNTPHIKIDSIYSLENTNYSFIDISISPAAKPGSYALELFKGNEEISVNFPLFERENSLKQHKGFSSDDVIYLLMPDRFADGDVKNNKVDGLIDDFNPEHPISRHGGDLKGVIDHLNYFTQLGVTALWLNPVLENNTNISYHGYAATNLYKIDPRLATNNLYKKFVDKAHDLGLKIIYDHVSNHISTNHPWIKNLPTKDWINGTLENHLNAWHNKMTLWDIHGNQMTKDHLTKGWFVDEMADLNQNNPFVKNYLIQNTIWWIEYSGIDGIREDTYPYAEQNFLSVWAQEILLEYPNFNIVGEVWTGETAFLAAYQKGSKLNTQFDSNLPAVTDFALQTVYHNYLKGNSDLYPIYNTIAKDYLYENPDNLLVFVDNHDVARAMFDSGGNIEKVKLIFTHLLTSRGIPQILYGTEIGMVGNNEDGVIRSNFPGGFPGDTRNAFNCKGRTETENDLFNFFKTLLELRKKHKSLSKGKLVHLPPVDNIYLYTKNHDDETILIILSNNNTEKEIDKTFIESLCGYNPSLFDVVNKSYSEMKNGKIVVEPMSAKIYLVDK